MDDVGWGELLVLPQAVSARNDVVATRAAKTPRMRLRRKQKRTASRPMEQNNMPGSWRGSEARVAAVDDVCTLIAKGVEVVAAVRLEVVGALVQV